MSLNPFEIFNLPLQFDLEESLLQERYFQGQRQFHPDRWIAGSQEEKEEATQQSARLNQAYDLLKNPLSRGFALLEALGVSMPSSLSQDPELLEEIFDLKEKKAHNPSFFMEEIQAYQKKIFTQISRAFQSQDLLLAASLLAKAQYLSQGEQRIL